MTEAEKADWLIFDTELAADPAPISNINSLIRMGRIRRFQEQMDHKYRGGAASCPNSDSENTQMRS